MDPNEIKRNGFYIDIGSANLTYLLEHKYHWSGICIDANPAVIDIVKKDRPNSICINSLVWAYNSYLDFEIDISDNLSGRISNIPHNKKIDNIINKQLIEAKTIEKICIDNNIKIPKLIDYIILDCNGSEIYILDYLLKQNKFKISNLSIRYYSNHKYLQQILQKIQAHNHIHINKIDEQYIDASDIKNQNQSIWISDKGLFSITDKKTWYAYIDNKHINNLRLVESNEHCKTLSNGINSYRICNNELYEIIANDCYKITNGRWLIL